jgi:hypothetical protein
MAGESPGGLEEHQLAAHPLPAATAFSSLKATRENPHLNRKATTVSRLRKLGANKPRYRFGFVSAAHKGARFSQALPMQRSWAAIGFVAAFLAAFCVPFYAMSGRMIDANEDLFDLVFNFMFLFGVLVWGAVLLGLFGLLVALLFARESISADRKGITTSVSVFGFGVSAFYAARALTHLRLEREDEQSGTSRRGEQVCFDYFGVPINAGPAMDSQQAAMLTRNIEKALGFELPLALSTALEIQQEKETLAAARAEQAEEQSLEQEKARARLLYEQDRQALRWNSPSAILLMLANALPLGGVLWFGWNIGDLFILFWIESAIIGIFNVIKMLVISKWEAIFMGAFFIGHFGAFMAGHLLFIFGFFMQGMESRSPTLDQTGALLLSMWPAVLALVASHGFSFFDNFIKRKEYLLKTVKEQMGEPYKRIIIMHFTIILGGFMVMALHAPVLALLLLIVLKTGMDFSGHIREHNRPRKGG